MKNNNELQMLREENKRLKEKLIKKENCIKQIKQCFFNFLNTDNKDRHIDKMFSIFERFE